MDLPSICGIMSSSGKTDMLFPTNNLPHFSPAVHSPGRLVFLLLTEKEPGAGTPGFRYGNPGEETTEAITPITLRVLSAKPGTLRGIRLWSSGPQLALSLVHALICGRDTFLK